MILTWIERIPTAAYYYRAITYQAMNGTPSAIANFNKTLEIFGDALDIWESARDELSKLSVEQWIYISLIIGS